MTADQPTMTVTVTDPELDVANAETVFERVIEQVRAAQTYSLDVDVSAVTFVDSSAMSQMIILRDFVEGHGGRVRFVGVNHRVCKVLTVIGLYDVLDLQCTHPHD